MTAKQIPIMSVVKLADRIRRAQYESAGIPELTPTLIGLAGGLDVALTLMELFVGSFESLSLDEAVRIVKYFRSEAATESERNLEVSFWYSAYADAVEQLFLVS
jgi:hypothetical protein